MDHLGRRKPCLSHTHILYGHHIFCMSGNGRKQSLNGEVKVHTHIKCSLSPLGMRKMFPGSLRRGGCPSCQQSEYDMEHDNVFFYF